MTKQQTKRILRIVLLVATIISMFFVPWILIRAWILPLPETVQEQVDEAIGHGFDGMIVYVDESDKPPEFYAAGWHDRKNKIPTDPHALFKIASIGRNLGLNRCKKYHTSCNLYFTRPYEVVH